MAPISLDNTPLNVVATTSIIGDVVAQVGGEQIALTTLIGPGQDPHSFEPGARDLTAVAGAHVIFVNGWDLEETLVHDLQAIGEGVPLVAVSANVEPLPLNQDQESGQIDDPHHHPNVDPHVWFSIHNVKQWVENIAHVLGDLEPANAQYFEANSTAYIAELDELDQRVRDRLADIPPGKRFLVTNHDSLGYFADEYGFEVLATVMPGGSTLAEPSASELAGLIEVLESHDLCTIFSETTVSDALAQTVAAELGRCDQVQVRQIYTGSLGPVGSGADSYVGMFQVNLESIVEGIR